MNVTCPHDDCKTEWEFHPTLAIPEPTRCPKCMRKLTKMAVMAVKRMKGQPSRVPSSVITRFWETPITPKARKLFHSNRQEN